MSLEFVLRESKVLCLVGLLGLMGWACGTQPPPPTLEQAKAVCEAPVAPGDVADAPGGPNLGRFLPEKEDAPSSRATEPEASEP